MNIFVDPAYAVYYKDQLFNLDDRTLNRDDQLLPFHRARAAMAAKGYVVKTADHLFGKDSVVAEASEYVSFGILENFEKIWREKLARLSSFVIMEPPVVVPALYRALPRISELFERVYLHNPYGHGYSLKGVQNQKLRKLYWPIPYAGVLQPFWSNRDRQKRIVVINGNHIPHSREGELYSTRIEAMAEFARLGVVDLYGTGWNRWWSRNSLWWPYWRNRNVLMSIYKGSCPSKFEVLQNYEFCLCLENMQMDGWITEKLFDCLYAGTIPLYLGPSNIDDLIPPDAFIDCRKYANWTDLWKAVSTFPAGKINSLREAGRVFLESNLSRHYFNSLEGIFSPVSL